MTETDHYVSKHWDYAKATLDALRDHGLRPTPELYHVWFVYYAEENPEILRVIDAVKATGEAIGEEALLQLYYRYIFDRQAADFLQRGMEDFSDVVENSDACLSSTRDELRVYSDVLGKAETSLKSGEKAEEVIHNVVLHTGRMQTTVESLHEQLGEYLKTIAHLQRELHETRERSYTDGLTRVSNRMHFEEVLASCCVEFDGGNIDEPFCVMMVDLDQFKAVNDKYGHRIGDEILVLIASMIKANTKGRDLVARYGGDEFAILLPQTPLKDAMLLADDMSKRIAAREVRAKSSGTSFGHMTVSVGVAEYVKGEGAAKVVDRADSALYRAKRDGRNRNFAAE
ncbi:GGDEF domain-containing protein [Thalassospira sp. MCCC 1A03138]|uniref:GGDEF domain-containing protein n=1 Tax=Thalassospira sp. MCCC 1A03138 TaxID=1470576 RepID=UPI000A1FA954|nr:GGDEF domain-containing protein [Thalassospira sp. MCCC 1A03138]OSQ32535.1 diguanylate cyclase [Thalassospira sp. MCCC 1A03138]